MHHKKFIDIQSIKPEYANGFNIGDYIIIQEKIDGANAAIRYDSETDTIVAQSRKNILNLSNNLRGFYEWSQTLDKALVKSVLGDNLILFMEWLVPHTVAYPNERYNHSYCYDVYNTDTEEYLPQKQVKQIVEKLNLTYVPVFYEGEFVSWEHCMSFVGKTELGGEYSEGIIVKNQTMLSNPNTRQPFYIKIVGEKFQETHTHREPKIIDPETMQKRVETQKLAETIVTKARVEKLLNKFVDEGILPENWSLNKMPIVAKNLTKAVYEDCVKEEPDIVKQIDNFSKVANGIAMKLAREIANG